MTDPQSRVLALETTIDKANHAAYIPARPARIRRHPTELAMDTLSYRSVLNSVLAGYMAGMCGTIIGHPFDSAKVWMQTRDPTAAAAASKSTASKATPAALFTPRSFMRDYLAKSLSHTRALYRGISGPLLTVGLVQAVNFGVYDASRRMLYGIDHPHADQSLEYLHHDSMSNIAMASASAGAVLACFTLPMLTIKTQQQTRQIGLRQALVELSWRPVIRAMLPHFVTETGGRAVYFVTYEVLKRHLLLNRQRQQQATCDDGEVAISVVTAIHDGTISVQQRMLCAAASGITCWTIIFLLDAIRSRILASQHLRHQPHLWETTRKLYRQFGVRGFYRGFSVTVLRAGPVAAIVLPVYDVALEALSAW